MERVSRRALLAAGSGAAVASAVIGGGVAAAQTRPPGQPLTEWIERYVLVTQAANSKSARPSTAGSGTPTGPGYMTGLIYKDSDVSGGAVSSSANAVGRFRISGWVYGGGTAPQLVGLGSFDLAGRGKISATGASGFVGTVAVSGGTGEFAGVSGEARLANLAAAGGPTIVEFYLLADTGGR